MDNDQLRLKILRLIESDPSMSQRQIADELSTSLGVVKYFLKALLEVGEVEMDNSAKSDQKLRYLYIPRARGLSNKTGRMARSLAKKRYQFNALIQEKGRLEVELAAAPKKAQLCLG